jgi:hypothetical protein
MLRDPAQGGPDNREQLEHMPKGARPRLPKRTLAILIVAAAFIALNAPAAMRIGREMYAAWSVLNEPITARTSIHDMVDAEDKLHHGIVANNILTLHPHGGEVVGWHGVIIVSFAVLGQMGTLVIVEFIACCLLAVLLYHNYTKERQHAAMGEPIR